VRSVGVVVDPPFLDDLASLVAIGEQVLVQTLVTHSALKLSRRPVCIGLPGAM
jgi:hypothetical protein